MKRNLILAKIKNSITNNDPNAEVILYGSRARLDSNSESDWDILLLIDKDKITLEDEQKFRHPLYDIELDTGEIISLNIYSKNDWNNKLNMTPLYKNIKNEGVKL